MTDYPPPDVAEVLRHARCLQEVSDDDLEKLAALASIHSVEAAAVLFQEGSRCDRLYLVTSGLVGLDMCMPRRGCVRILTVGEGEFLGWSALLGNVAMTARATVLESGTLIAFPATQLRELCNQDHDVGYAIMRQIAQALSQRLLATRLQMLDVFGRTNAGHPAHRSPAAPIS